MNTVSKIIIAVLVVALGYMLYDKLTAESSHRELVALVAQYHERAVEAERKAEENANQARKSAAEAVLAAQRSEDCDKQAEAMRARLEELEKKRR